MPPARRIPRPAHASLELLLPDIATGVRAALATVVPFGLAAATGHHELAVMAIGGWLGTLVDPGGSRAARAIAVLSFAILGSAGVVVAERAAAWPAAQVITVAAIAFGGTLLRVLGEGGARLGTMLGVSAAIAAGTPTTDPARDALYFALGSLVALLLSSIVWPIWTHKPARRALGAAFAALAEYTRSVRAIAYSGADEHDPRWLVLGRTRLRSVRAALEEARQHALAVRRRHSGESATGSALRILIGLAEQQFQYVITLAEELRALPPDARRPPWRDALEELAEHLAEVRLATLTHRAPPHPAPRAAAPGHATPGHAAPARTPEHAVHAAAETIEDLFASLREDVDAALRLAAAPRSPWQPLTPPDEPAVAASLSARVALEALRDALDPRSPFFRHAMRAGLAIAVATLVAFVISPDHTAWVTVTTLIVLQPYAGATWQRAGERLLGTVLGSALAFGIALVVREPWEIALAMFPLSIAAVTARPRSFPLFTLFLTPPFLLLTATQFGDRWAALTRVGDASAGGLIAMVASLAVFPTAEHRRLHAMTADMIAAVSRFVDEVLRSFGGAGAAPGAGPGAPPQVVDARRAAGIAVSAAELGLENVLGEVHREPGEAEGAMQLITYARRVATSTAALDTLGRDAPAVVVAAIPGARLAECAARLLSEPPLPHEPQLVDPVAAPRIAIAVDRLFKLLSLLGAERART